MQTSGKLILITSIAAALSGCALPPASPPQEGAAHVHGATPSPTDGRAQMMDKHMKSMDEMNRKMAQARTPEERDAIKAEHMKHMHEGMGAKGRP